MEMDAGRQGGSSSKQGSDGGVNPLSASTTKPYCLFPEHGRRNEGPLFDIFSAAAQPKLKQPAKLEVDGNSAILTPNHPKVSRGVQPQLPFQARSSSQGTVFPQGIHSCSSQAMTLEDNNGKETAGLSLQGQTSNHENMVPSSGAGSSGAQFSGAPGNVVQQESEATPLCEDDAKDLAHLIAVQKAYTRACYDPDQITPIKLLDQSTENLKHHYARDEVVAYYGDNPEDADTTILRSRRAAGSSRMHRSRGAPHNVHSSGIGLNTMSPDVQLRQQQQIVSPMNSTFRLMGIKGQVASFCADPNGSRLIQQALGAATPEEITMVYEEIMPCARTLVIDIFANHAVQKLLEHGPQSYKRKFIGHLIGHVLPLSLHMYGCRVIQKAFEVGELDQKIVMAKELGGKVMKCVRDQFANHVIQKCIECVPPRHIQFIFRSFCGKVKAMSTHPYGCHVIQKMLAFCNNPEVYHTLKSEIVEAVNKLSADQFGNYVVQHLLEHGGPVDRSTVVNKFVGRMVSMSYHKYASNVMEKCLTFGSYQDRQVIANEIIGAGGGQHFEHLMDMMINPYANFVIQKMVVTAEERQVGVLVDVARSNLATLMRYPHGRHVAAAIERLLSAKAGRMVLLGSPPLPPPQ